MNTLALPYKSFWWREILRKAAMRMQSRQYGPGNSVVADSARVYGGWLATFNPLSLSPTLWLKADAGLYTDAAKTIPAGNDDLVYVWSDQSGNNLDAVQATSGNRPTCKTNFQLGKAVVQFSSGDRMTTPSFQPFAGKRGAVFVAFRNTVATDYSLVLATYNQTAPNFIFASTVSTPFYRWYDGAWLYSALADIPNNWYAGTLHYTADTVAKFYKNSYLEDTFAVTNQQFAANPLIIGGHDGGGFMTGEIGEILTFDVLSDANRQLVETYLFDRWVYPQRLIIFDGNSMTAGAGASAGNDYPAQTVAALLPTIYCKLNFGVPSQTTTQMIADAVAQIDAFYRTTYAESVVVCWEGTNELYYSVSAADAYNNLVAYCQARRAAGWKAIILTILPRSNIGTPAGFEADRQTVNTNIRANWATFADALADVAADTRIGDAGDELDTTYYTDLVHMTDAGYAIVAGIVKAAIEAL